MVSILSQNIRPRKIFNSVKVFTHSKISRLSTRKFQNKLDDIDNTPNGFKKFYKKCRKTILKSKYKKIILLAILGALIGSFCYAHGPSRELILLYSSNIKAKLVNCFPKASDPVSEPVVEVVEITSNPTPVPKTTNKIVKHLISIGIVFLIAFVFKSETPVESPIPVPEKKEHEIEDIPFILIYGLISGVIQVYIAGVLLYYNII